MSDTTNNVLWLSSIYLPKMEGHDLESFGLGRLFGFNNFFIVNLVDILISWLL